MLLVAFFHGLFLGLYTKAAHPMFETKRNICVQTGSSGRRLPLCFNWRVGLCPVAEASGASRAADKFPLFIPEQ